MSEPAVWHLILYAFTSLVLATFSGIAGAGGGFIMTPLLIFLGLTPAEAVSTGKLGGLSVSLGSLHGYKTQKVHNKKFVVMVMGLALVVGLLAPFFIVQLEQDLYKRILGVLILVMIPVVWLKQIGIRTYHPSSIQKTVGWFLLVGALMMQGVFSGGMGVLVIIVLMSFLGLDSLTAQITKRWSQVLLNTAIVLGVIGSGLIVWKFAIIGICTNFFGARLGAKLAIKKGNGFVMNIFIVLMLLSAIGLLVS